MKLPLFVYGTMRDEDVRALVLGRAPPAARAEPAWMPGVAAAVVPGESYPYLVSVDGARASGERVAAIHFGGLAIPEAPVVTWSLKQWQAQEKSRFLSMTHEYMALWRRSTRVQAEAQWQRLLREHAAKGGVQ